jgi:UDP-N-acetylglucosamine acyltransferase
VVGNRVVLVNGALLAGHVQIADRAFISGNCLVHQFVRIGTLSLMQGGSAATRDLPPYTVARGFNNICGLNVVGLRRNGISSEERSELKKLYHRLFRSGENRSASLDDLRREFTLPTARTLLDFIASSTRGVSGEHAFSASESTGEEDEDAID